MAELRSTRKQRSFPVEPELLVGRSPTAGLQIARPYVSAQHAVLRWAGKAWEIKDLGSRNGTLLHGVRLQAGQFYALTRGAELCFGHVDESWTLVDDAAPLPMAVPVGDGETIIAVDDILGFPSGEAPQLSIHRDADGVWKLEDETGDVRVLQQRAQFDVNGQTYRFCFPEASSATATADFLRDREHLALEFFVSRDEEHVELKALSPHGKVDLGSRSHNYMLLTLARLRLRDVEAGLGGTAAGWTYQPDLIRALATTQMQLNIDVFRLRQHFARAGLQELVTVIERRTRTRQLRIGVSDLRIESL